MLLERKSISNAENKDKETWRFFQKVYAQRHGNRAELDAGMSNLTTREKTVKKAELSCQKKQDKILFPGMAERGNDL